MAESPPPRRMRGLRRAARIAAVALFGLVAMPSYADLRPPARARAAPPMRFVRVTSDDPACKPDCPEWLSAEGRIVPGSAKAFAEAVRGLKGRQLPVLLHSPGGSVPDAAAMGQTIRVNGLAVAVARTLIANCPESAPKCPDGPGRAITGGATCASACVLMLAGGVERLAGPRALIGVHQTTTLMRESEGAAGLKSTRKIYEQPRIDAAVTAYLAAMGVGEPVMTLMRRTSAASIRWLSLSELRDSHLATLALDAADPILTSGANGLNAEAFDGAPPRPDLIEASLSAPLHDGGATVTIGFRYRRGGGAIEAETARDGAAAALASLTLSADDAEPVRLQVAGASPATALIPRERFCALAHGGAILAASSPGGPQGFAPVRLAALDGAKALIAEACP
jgi:hypothetical protein